MYTDINGNKWYKGNLHTHTTRSDGRSAPEDTIELYKNNGYDFIAITDHWKISDNIEGEILQISGCEYDTGNTVVEGIYHVVALGIDNNIDMPKTGPKPPAQYIIDKINANNGIAILAHPAWSMNTPSEIKKLHGFSGIEIYNTVSDMPRNLRGFSGGIVDRLAAENYILNCVASDDTHFYDGDQCKSFVWVKADTLTQDSILTAIKNGDFIASQNPFFTYKFDTEIEVNCTPVEIIAFMTDTVYTTDRIVRGTDITHATYKIKPTDTFVRIELIDSNGNHAWSSPIKVR
jgi:Predicted metal-dependent phosphoesterases (PHP family)